MDSHQKIAFLPFNAINEFMRSDYRLQVVEAVFRALPGLNDAHQAAVNRQVKQRVQVPGFRNSTQAPLTVKIRPAAKAFEKSPDFVGVFLAAWSASKPELRQHVFELLTLRGWEMLPSDADRTKLPGFQTTWPQSEDFAKINEAFSSDNPGFDASTDDVSLMAVWLSGRLPIDQESSSNEAGKTAGSYEQ